MGIDSKQCKVGDKSISLFYIKKSMYFLGKRSQDLGIYFFCFIDLGEENYVEVKNVNIFNPSPSI
jgi:hypothetical protein